MAVRHVRDAADAPPSEWTPWRSVVEIEGGPVHLSALPVIDDDTPRGVILLLHDFGFAERREAQIQHLLVGTFAVLACAASLITVVVRRASWRGWTNEIRRVLRGGLHKPEFQPLISDVRDLVDRLSAERDLDGSGGLWTPERLKDSLRHRLHGERVVVLANREPYIHERHADGGIEVTHPASGLVTALEPVMRACSGVWVAHGSGIADRETVDAQGPRARAAGRRVVHRCAASGSRRRKSRATTTASPTRACGRSATSRTRGRSSAPTTGSSTSEVNERVRRRGRARRWTPTTRSSSCRTTTSRSRRS